MMRVNPGRLPQCRDLQRGRNGGGEGGSRARGVNRRVSDLDLRIARGCLTVLSPGRGDGMAG